MKARRDAIASHGFDAVWFMGVWERSPAGIDISMRNPGLLEDFTRALPDFTPEDNVGSPYCVRRYVVDPHLGGPKGLAAARRQLGDRGLRLILDFVPNHVAPDHPWVAEHPEYFVRGTPDDARNDPASFVEIGGRVFARGRDPYFPAWPDVLQLNALQPGLRQAVVETISEIAEQCDGIRCDMAMLMLNAIFERTWGARVGAKPDGDYCYDKKLYDRMEHADAESVRQHLLAETSYQDKKSGSSRTTTSPGPPRRWRPGKRARRPSRSSRFPERGFFTRGSSRAGRSGCPSS